MNIIAMLELFVHQFHIHVFCVYRIQLYIWMICFLPNVILSSNSHILIKSNKKYIRNTKMTLSCWQTIVLRINGWCYKFVINMQIKCLIGYQCYSRKHRWTDNKSANKQKRIKGQTMIFKIIHRNERLKNTNLLINRGWSLVPRKGMQFLFLSCYSCYKFDKT